ARAGPRRHGTCRPRGHDRAQHEPACEAAGSGRLSGTAHGEGRPPPRGPSPNRRRAHSDRGPEKTAHRLARPAARNPLPRPAPEDRRGLGRLERTGGAAPMTVQDAPRSPILVPMIVGSALFMQMLDSTVIATALPKMAESFGE